MKLEIYQVDAFASEIFAGNQAAVVPLVNWLSDEVMQKVAAENNLSNTAFYIPVGDNYHIRWFTPLKEVDLCGHATLAASFIINNKQGFLNRSISFNSRSGILEVEKKGDYYILDFPRSTIHEIKIATWMEESFSVKPAKAYQCSLDIMLIYENEEVVTSLVPNFQVLQKVETRGVITTALGDSADFVSRFFAPAAGIDEDSVTGSAHTALAPYWGGVLGKDSLKAKQVSKRGGELNCEVFPNRVKISGKASLYMKGIISLD